jgi:ubiquinone/menaquinone biosynthesis C-methylase UbiE
MLSKIVNKDEASRVLDLCCGVGISTRALANAFPSAQVVLGVDTSAEMVNMANSKKDKRPIFFTRGNAEDTKLPGNSFDLITIMYAFHEVPKSSRAKILTEAHRLLRPKGTLAIVDTITSFEPSKYVGRTSIS